MPSEPGVHVGGHSRRAGECSAPFLHATEPDPQLKPSGTRSELDDVLGRKETERESLCLANRPYVAATPLVRGGRDLVSFLRRKVRLERRGFVGPVIASAEASIWRLRDALRPARTEMPFTDSSFPSGHRLRRTPEALPLRSSALETCNSALSQPLAFELAQCGENCELEPPAGGAEVQALLQRHERNVQRLEILEHRQEMFQIPSDSIERPAHHYVDFRSPRVEQQSIQTRPAVLRPAHLVGVFGMNNPAPRLAVATELEELVLAGLGSVGGADAGVDRGLHGNTAASFPGALPLSFGMILTVILSSLRYARIRGGSTRSVPEQTRSVGGVPAWNVLKGDQRVIGLWDSDGIGTRGLRACGRYPSR